MMPREETVDRAEQLEVEAPLSFWRRADGVQWAHAKAIFGITAASAGKAIAPPPVEVKPTPKRRKPAAAPKPAAPRPERVPVGSARELSWLADSSFPELSEL